MYKPFEPLQTSLSVIISIEFEKGELYKCAHVKSISGETN